MSGIENKLPQIPIDFATLDYKGFFEMMKNEIPTFTPEWTDTSDTDQGIVILQLLSYGLHVLGYYQERVMQENILEYARTKKGVLTSSGFLGYVPERQTNSSVMLTIQRDSDYLLDKSFIPKGSKFSTDPKNGTPIIFETSEPLTIPEGETVGKVIAVQGETITGEQIGLSDGKPNQKYTLEYPDVLVESLYIYTYENSRNILWTKVDNFVDSKRSDRHYTVILEEEDKTTVQFGDGVLGMKPPIGSNITSTYRVGGGIQGNLAPNLITYVYESDHDLNFIETVTNADYAMGGKDYENIEITRIKAPKYYRSRMQAITPLDFKDIAELTEGVLKAKVVETFVTTSLYIYLLDTNFNPAGEGLCNTVAKAINANRVGNVDLRVLPCEAQEFTIKVKVYTHDKFDKEQVAEQVKSNLESYFNVSNFDFGQEFFVSTVYNIAFATAGVKNVVVDGNVTTDLAPTKEYEILKLTDVIVEVE